MNVFKHGRFNIKTVDGKPDVKLDHHVQYNFDNIKIQTFF